MVQNSSPIRLKKFWLSMSRFLLYLTFGLLLIITFISVVSAFVSLERLSSSSAANCFNLFSKAVKLFIPDLFSRLKSSSPRGMRKTIHDGTLHSTSIILVSLQNCKVSSGFIPGLVFSSSSRLEFGSDFKSSSDNSSNGSLSSNILCNWLNVFCECVFADASSCSSRRGLVLFAKNGRFVQSE
jgi:hypothetical protein